MNWLAFANAVALAISTIRAHKMRAVLTVLGVVMGTGTIIGVGAILTGFDSSITAVLNSFGPNSIIVFKFPAGFHAPPTAEERTRKDITYSEAVDIRNKCEVCDEVSPLLFVDNGLLSAKYKGNDIYGIDLMGVEEAYGREGQVDIHSGRFLTDEENRQRAAVAVLGADVAKSLYANVDPIGKPVTVNGHEYEVIGTMNRPAASFFGQDDMRVLLPYWTLQKNYPAFKDMAIVANAVDGQLPRALDEVRTILRIDRRVPLKKPDDFALSTAEQMVSDFREITSMVAIVMVALSSVGLLVGGIGVMNIMLVSVTERTKEIGVRKAIGAKKSDIILQFLSEAVVLTGMGGIAGIIFGWLIAVISRLIFPSLPTTVPLWAAALGLFVSAGTGLFFGIWPASKAARLDPVEALRYE
ncbi:MAG: ABC transporter permease [Acidobacteriaceae bacterium]|nr:ABC transporter permease [Acidobacteriaceae bacterium]MBV9500328.1 ABC transporter permease [Acidobacteriaceae bacterium]